MEIILEIPKDINKVCRTCLNVAEADEGILYHRLIQNNQPTDISKFFESVTSLKVFHLTVLVLFIGFIISDCIWRWFTRINL